MAQSKLFDLLNTACPQPILPSSLMSTDLPTTLSTLASAKQSINTHMTQLLTACWRKWDIAIPNVLIERKDGKREKERDGSAKPASWWGPGKSVPSMVVVGMNVSMFESGSR
jgi:hypothetical protein